MLVHWLCFHSTAAINTGPSDHLLFRLAQPCRLQNLTAQVHSWPLNMVLQTPTPTPPEFAHSTRDILESFQSLGFTSHLSFLDLLDPHSCLHFFSPVPPPWGTVSFKISPDRALYTNSCNHPRHIKNFKLQAPKSLNYSFLHSETSSWSFSL